MMDQRTYLAVGELVQAASHQQGIIGPVEYRVLHDPIQLDLFKDRSAVLDRKRVFRYELWRRWSDGDRYVNFICLNPSTADESADDPTVRKCIKFAKAWGFDALCITNLFAYRATYPRQMIKAIDPIGLGNDRHIRNVAGGAGLVVCAWGRDGSFMGRGQIVRRMVARFDPHYLRLTREQPWHPLYLPDNTRPSRWYSAKHQASLTNKGE